MNKKLRLLLTPVCNRNCEGCCNKDHDLEALDTFYLHDSDKYDIVMLTGGEAMLNPLEVRNHVRALREHNPNVQIYLYTAKIDDLLEALSVLKVIDGYTLTLHEEEDKVAFTKFNDYLLENPWMVEGKSMRLNIFKEVGELDDDLKHWIVKDQMEWIVDCPIPDDEDFKRVQLFIK